jgi:hypothetical protein
LKSGLDLKVLQNPFQNPTEPGITIIQAGAFTLYYPTFMEDGKPCKPWVGEPTCTYEGGDRLSGEILEAYDTIESEARLLAISVVIDHRARLERKAKKEALNPRFPGFT